MSVEEFQRAVDEWIRTIGVRYFSPLTNMAILAEEVGEVGRYMARIHGEQSFKSGENEKHAKDHLADELSDVMWVVACLANQHDINLEEAIVKNFEKKTQRDAQRHIQNNK